MVLLAKTDCVVSKEQQSNKGRRIFMIISPNVFTDYSIPKKVKLVQGFLFFIILLCVLFGLSTYANPNDAGGTLNNTFEVYLRAVQNWQPELVLTAKYFLITLATISLTYRLFWLALSDNSSISSLIAEIVKLILIVGFYLWLLNNVTTLFLKAIFEGFIALGQNVSGFSSDLKPSGIIVSALVAIENIFKSISWYDSISATSLFKLVIAVIILVLFCVIAVNALFTMIKFIVITYGALVMLGFAVAEWTRDWTIAYLRSIVAAGFTYYAMILTLDLSLNVFTLAVEDFKAASGVKDTWVPLTTLFVAAIITYMTTTEIPPLFGAMISNIGVANNGISVAQGMKVAAMAGAMAAGGAVAAAKAGAGGAASAAKATDQIMRTIDSKSGGKMGYSAKSDAVKNAVGGAMEKASAFTSNASNKMQNLAQNFFQSKGVSTKNQNEDSMSGQPSGGAGGSPFSQVGTSSSGSNNSNSQQGSDPHIPSLDDGDSERRVKF